MAAAPSSPPLADAAAEDPPYPIGAPMAPQRIVLVHNPKAGDGDHSAEAVRRLVARGGEIIAYHPSKADGLHAAMAQPADLIVVAGGDGTVRKVMMALADPSPPLAILPLGSANNIARSLGVLGPPEAVVAAWRRSAVVAFDLGSAAVEGTCRRFCEGFGVGAFAQLLLEEETDPPPPGPREATLQRALLTLRRVIAEAPPVAVSILAGGSGEGTAFEGEAILAEILTTRFFGPGLPMAPDARSNDRLLDLVVIPVQERRPMLDWLDAGGRDALPSAVRARAAAFRFGWAGSAARLDDMLWDGENGKRPRQAEIAIGRSVPVLVPADTG